MSDPIDELASAVDDAPDELTGVPTDGGRIEQFSHDGATVIAE